MARHSNKTQLIIANCQYIHLGMFQGKRCLVQYFHLLKFNLTVPLVSCYERSVNSLAIYHCKNVSRDKVPIRNSRNRNYEHSDKNEQQGKSKWTFPIILFAAPPILATVATSNKTQSDAKSFELSDHILHDSNVDMVKVRGLLKNGADPNFRYRGGWTLLHVAVSKGSTQLVKMLLRFGADVDLKDEYTPYNQLPSHELHVVNHQRLALNGNFKANADWRGFTPLHYAVLCDEEQLVKVLVEAGASVRATTQSGFLPIDLSDDKDIKNILKEREEAEIKERILSLGPFLRDNVVGQERALAAVTAAVQRRDLGWQDDKPLVMLFVGSSGIGKTETAKQLAAHKDRVEEGNSEVSFIRVDMSEFQERHEVAKFIGSPPGYVGHEEGGQLTKQLAAHPHSVVLFDEVEKAHPDVLNIMLQLFDEGRLTDGKGKTIVCPNAIFVMTTNVGADSIAASGGEVDEDFKKRIMYPQLKYAFKRNEFLGRINEIVYFLPFNEDQCTKLVEIELEKIKQYAEKQNISLSWSREAVEHLASAIDSNYGARSLKNEVSRQVVNKLADMNLENKIGSGSNVKIDCVNDAIEFEIMNSS